jgi:archaellum biogenesis protein FlaJ (TadC family)
MFFIAPFFVHLAVMIHDFVTADIGRGVSNLHTTIVLTSDVVLLFVIGLLTVSVLIRLHRVDMLWYENSPKIKPPRAPAPATQKAA